MEKEEKNERAAIRPAAETEFMLQWGNRKRVRCVRVHPSNTNNLSRFGRKSFLTVKQPFFPPQTSTRLARNSETATLRSENGKSSSGSPERHYTTRGSVVVGLDENGKNIVDGGARNQGGDERNNNNNNNNNDRSKYNSRGVVWPKIYITLSSKEKEEDFLAMKGCKLPQRPKKRAKAIQRTLLLVSPGAWLTDMSRERYEVREKKSSKKRPRGLKAMGSVESDSE